MEGVIVVVYWLAIAGLILVSTIAGARLWTSRRTRGGHSNYDPAFSVLAVAARMVRESALPAGHKQNPTMEGGSG